MICGIPHSSIPGPSLFNAAIEKSSASLLISCFCFLLSVFSGYFLQTLFPPSQRFFQGCMQAILVDDQPADLHAVEKGTMGAFENVSLDMCAIIDR